MGGTRWTWAALLLGAASLAGSGCVSYDLAALLRAPTVGFHGLRPTSVQLGSGGLELHLLVQLDFRNYAGSTVTVPGHRLRFTLGHGDEVEAIVSHPQDLPLAPGGAVVVDYPVVFTFSAQALQPGNVFGTDAPYSFEILPEDDLANALLALLGQQFPDAVPRLRYRNTVRLPLPPAIQSVQLARARLLLDDALEASVDLGPARDALAGLLDPLLALPQWQLAVDALAGLGISVPPDVAALRDAWEDFETARLDVPLIVPEAVQGVRLEVPVQIRNQNDFPIEAPLATAGLYVGLADGQAAPARRRSARSPPSPSSCAGRTPEPVWQRSSAHRRAASSSSSMRS